MAPASPVFAGQARSHRDCASFLKLSKAVASTSERLFLLPVIAALGTQRGASSRRYPARRARRIPSHGHHLLANCQAMTHGKK